MLPFFDADTIHRQLRFPLLIEALAHSFTQTIESPARHVHSINPASHTSLLLMPAWQSGGQAGVKLVTVAPENRQLPSVHAVYILFDSVSGAPLALFDGEALTLRRTAAASALASRFLARPDSRQLLMVGNGTLAPHLAVAHSLVRPIRQILVWGRQPDKSQDCIEKIRAHPEFDQTIDVQICQQLEQACASADIISAATTSRQPLIPGLAVKAGCHIDLVGGFKPDMREADDELMRRAQVFVDTYTGALSEAGDLLQPLANGSLSRQQIVAELADLCSQRHAGRQDAQQITLFKSVGTALEDLSAAHLVWRSMNGEAG